MRLFSPRSTPRMAVRFFIAAIVVIGGVAATTAVAGLLQVQNLVNDISLNPPIKSKDVKLPAPGAPQTILLIGSDHRVGESFRQALTDTMLLVRLNAASSTINLLSIPRDLEVDIPGYGTGKLNAAYSAGGYNLLIKTIQQDVFPKFAPNHIVDVNFTAFSDLVDAIGCVYSDVDARYYNDTALTDYSSIDIQPGYQKLCGDNQSVRGALPFVRYRHTDSDLTRNARQQDFIRWAKDQYPISKLVSNRNRLLRIFGKHAQTDKQLHSLDGLIELFDLIENLDGDTIKQVKFPATELPCDPSAAVGEATVPCYLAPTSAAAVASAWARFMAPTPKPKPKPKSAATHRHHAAAKLSTAGLTPDQSDGRLQVAALPRVKMPIYYPRLLQTGTEYCSSTTGNCDDGAEPSSEYAHSYPREYPIIDPEGHRHAAYRMTILKNSLLGEYYGVQGTTWDNPPLLASPSGTKMVDGRKLFLYADGRRLTTVAWHHDHDAYWISNSLDEAIPNRELIGIAASLTLGRP